MNSEDLLVLSLTQLGFLKNDDPKSKISSVSQLDDELFREILYKIINKVIQIKNLEVTFPEKPSREMNKRFAEAQKSVEILKSLGFKGDVKMNSVLHPEKRDKERLLEFTLEIISSEDVGGHEIAQGMTEKNLVKMKIEKKLVEWQKDLWLIPELISNPQPQKKNEFFLKISETKTKEFKQIIKNSNVDNDFITAGKEIVSKVASNENINFIQEEDSQLSKYNLNEKNHNYIVNKLKKRKNANKFEKTTNQILIESLDKRAQTLQFLYSNYSENNFQNNVNILKKKNKEIYFKQIGLNLSSSERKKNTGKNGEIGEHGENGENVNVNNENPNQSGEENTQQFKNKLDAIISNFEAEKKAKNDEIIELNTKLLNITNNIENLKKTHRDNEELKNQLVESLNKLTEENNELLKEIEEEMTAFEQMKKLQKNEIAENDVVNEVEKLETKYQDMVKDWTDYSNQVKNQIQEYKSSIDEKKKEYKYKYDPNCALDNLLKNLNNEIHYIKCSSMNEKNVRDELEKYLFEEMDDIIFVSSLSGHLRINNNESNLFLINLGYFPKYVEEIESFENDKDKICNYYLGTIEKLERKIKNTISDKANMYNMQIINIINKIIEKEGLEIPRNEFKSFFKFLPLKHIYPRKINNDKYSFHYSFKLLRKVFLELKKKIITDLTSNYYEVLESGSKAGFVFEEIVQGIFKEGKSLFNDEKNVIKKEIYVNSIYNLKEVIFSVQSNNKNIKLKENNTQVFELNDINEKIKYFKEEIVEGEINTIIQKPCGEYYDIAILIPNKSKNKREFDMFLGQITLDKKYLNFIERSLIVNSLNQIKKRFEIIFNIKLKKFYFSYILEKSRKGRNNVEKYCNEFHNRLYYSFFYNGKLYSKDTNTLFSLGLMKRNCLISKLSNNNISYNLNSSQIYKTLMNNSLKINFKNQSNFEYIINESEKRDIIEKTNLLCEFYNGEKIKTFLKKKRNVEKDEEPQSNHENNEIREIIDENIQNNQPLNQHELKLSLKKEGIEMHKINKNLIHIGEPGEEEKKNFILEDKSKKKVYTFGEDDKKKICKILGLQDSNLKIIERGAFFPLNICGIEHYFILYYNIIDNATKIIVKYSEKDSIYKYWNLEKCQFLKDKDGFEFLNLINNPVLFFKNYSSYLISISMKDENDEDKYLSNEEQ